MSGPGDYRYKGGDLGILVSRGRFQADDGKLSERASLWVQGIKRRFTSTPLDDASPAVGSASYAVKGAEG